MSNRCTSYINEIESVSKEIKRLSSSLKKLRLQKARAEENLANVMEKEGIDQIGKIKLEKIKPKEKLKRKSKKEKKQEAITLFYQIGVPDPEGFYQEFEKTQKATKNL